MCNLEKFYVYTETINSDQINDKNIVLGNLLFDTIISNDVYQ
jgi:hypothetical protein